jgi:glycosyltransferase involved in cell wall biosynthesis
VKISIIIATYNSELNILCSLKSILEQSYNDYEIIIVDGASTDKTLKIVQDLCVEFSDIRILSEKDFGIYDALNKGINLATGDVIGFLHSDDKFGSSKILSEVVNEFDKSKIDGVYGNLNYISKTTPSRIIRNWQSQHFDIKFLKKGWMPAHPTFFLKKEVYDKHGLFDLKFTISADYDFMLRVLKDETLKFLYLQKVITNMRVGGTSNKSLRNIAIKMVEDYRAIRKNKIGGIFTLILKNISKIKQFIN